MYKKEKNYCISERSMLCCISLKKKKKAEYPLSP